MASLLDRFRHPRAEEPAAGAEATPAPRRRALPSPGHLRRERRNLLRVREQQIRDIGGLVLEMYRQDRFRQDLIYEQAAEIVALEERLREVDELLIAASNRRGAAGISLRAVRHAAVLGRALLPELRPPGDGGADVTQPSAGACPRCGTAYAPGQEYCLECGLRLPARSGLFSGVAAAWARRGWYPGDWVWPVLVFLVLAGIGALAAILLSGGSGNTGTIVGLPPPASTGGQGVTVPTTPTETTPTVTQPPPTTTPPTTTPHPSSQLTTWPTRDGYTVILQSIPAGASRANAVRTAKQALAASLPQVGVLDSAQYSSLHPGYYVVFSGVYPSNAAASVHITEAQQAGFRAAYVRPITH